MEVNLHNYRPGDDSRQRLALTHMTNDQARTVYFALLENHSPEVKGAIRSWLDI
jgi:hypothetical protein